MKQFSYDGGTFNVVENWDELTLKQLIQFSKIDRDQKFDSDIEEIIFLSKIIEILSDLPEGEIDQLDVLLLGEVMKSVQVELLSTTPEFKKQKSVVINDILYGFKDPNKMNLGEVISYKEYQKKFNGFDSIPYLLAIICRPATINVNKETGLEEVVLDKFEASDIEYRHNIMMDQPAFKLMGAVNFFFSGSKASIKSTKGSTPKKLKA